jgi:hypothetical protein
MDPMMTTVASSLLSKTASELTKKVYELVKKVKDREHQQQLDEIVGKLRELSQSASEQEDEIRDLREKLRFKSDEYEFRTPFWYHKDHPARALCPACFAKILQPRWVNKAKVVRPRIVSASFVRVAFK